PICFVFYAYFRRRKGNERLLNKNTSQQKNAQGSDLTNDAQVRSPYRDKYFLIFSFLCLLFAICFFQLLSTLPLFYKQEFHLEDSGVGLILAFNGFVVFLLEMLLVHLAEKKIDRKSTRLNSS